MLSGYLSLFALSLAQAFLVLLLLEFEFLRFEPLSLFSLRDMRHQLRLFEQLLRDLVEVADLGACRVAQVRTALLSVNAHEVVEVLVN